MTVEGPGRASARPERLTNLAETTGGIFEGLTRRAGHLDDAVDLYQADNAVDWRFDCGDLPGAVTAWAEAVRGLGEWTGQVGEAFLDADDDDPGDVHHLYLSELRELLPDDARRILDDSHPGSYVDWGDPDEPPAWLDDLQTGAKALSIVSGSTDGVDLGYVTRAGADFTRVAPDWLGRFATPAGISSFAWLLGAGDVALSGFSAGAQQWLTDSESLNYTDREAARRTLARGGGTAIATGAGSALGAVAVNAISTPIAVLCGPAAPLCAGGVVIGTGLWFGEVSGGTLDRLLGSPGPAQHDPDLVEDQVAGLEPQWDRRDIPHSDWGGLEQIVGRPSPVPDLVRDGAGADPDYRLADIPDATWDAIEQVHDAGETAAAQLPSRHPFLDRAGFHPDMAADYDLPVPWIAENHGALAAALSMGETPEGQGP